MLRDIVQYGDPVLRTVSVPVDIKDPETHVLARDLVDTLAKSETGIGLAAPQIGVNKRVIALRGPDKNKTFYVMYNPEIVAVSKSKIVYREGCLSIPNFYFQIIRPRQVKVNYQDQHGNVRQMVADDEHAVCLQHEIQHLDGKLFIENVAPLDRSLIDRLLKAKGFAPFFFPEKTKS